MDALEEEAEDYQVQNYDRVLKVIRKIKSNRNRAGYQNIQSFHNRTEPKLSMPQLKETLQDLVEKGIIVMKLKDEVESFHIVEDITEATDSQSKEQHGDDSVEHLMNYLDEAFNTVLIDRIKNDIMCDVDEKIKQLNINELNHVSTPNINKRDSDTIGPLHDEIRHLKNELKISDIREINYDEQINALRNEITFLKSEIQSKNSIIILFAI